MKKTKTDDPRIAEIYEQGTFTHPSAAVGKAIIRALLDFGADKDAALWVYQSKHVRWSNVAHSQTTAKGAYRAFTEYLETDSNNAAKDIRNPNRGELRAEVQRRLLSLSPKNRTYPMTDSDGGATIDEFEERRT